MCYQRSTTEDDIIPQAETCLTVKDVCQQLKCSKESVYRYVKAGKLKAAFRLGNRLRFFQKDVNAFMQRQASKISNQQSVISSQLSVISYQYTDH